MDLLKSLEQRRQERIDLVRRERPPGLDPLLHRAAAHEFHHHVGRAVGLDEIEDLHDGRRFMKACQGPALSHEAFPSPREILGDLGGAWQHRRAVLANRERRRQVFLQGNFAVELGVADTIGDAETTLAQHLQDLIAADHAAGRQRHIVDDSCRVERFGGLLAGIVVFSCHVTPAPQGNVLRGLAFLG